MLVDDWPVSKAMHKPQPSARSIARIQSRDMEKSSFNTTFKRVDAELGLKVHETKSTRLARLGRLFLCAILFCAAFLSFPLPTFISTRILGGFDISTHLETTIQAQACAQVATIAPTAQAQLLEDLESEFVTESYRLKAYESLGAAVRIPYVLHSSISYGGVTVPK